MNKQPELTTVTSINDLEKSSGEKIEVPSSEKLVASASGSLIACRKRARELMEKMPKRQLVRAVTAFLDLPTEGLPVYLKTEEEKLLFMTGQRAIADRFIIIQHYINEQIKQDRLEQQLKEKENG